jgi:2,3-bisphosphoglycerate-dependent phosphoglycerate mutase
MIEILVVRHGQSTADLEDRHEGRADFPLTELGLLQARKVANWINTNYPPEILISSPLIRAATTAKFIGETVGVDVQYDEDLKEWNNGLLAGLLRVEAEQKYPLPEGGRKPHDEFYESESYISFRARVEKFWSKLLDPRRKDINNKRICIVSHGGTITMLYRSFLNLPMNTNVGIYTGDTGVHLWRIENDQRIILFSNYQNHLL